MTNLKSPIYNQPERTCFYNCMLTLVQPKPRKKETEALVTKPTYNDDSPAQPVVKLLLPAHHQMGWQLHIQDRFWNVPAPLCPNGNSPASRLFIVAGTARAWVSFTAASLLFTKRRFSASLASSGTLDYSVWATSSSNLSLRGSCDRGSTSPLYPLSSGWVKIATKSSERSSISLITDHYSTPTPIEPSFNNYKESPRAEPSQLTAKKARKQTRVWRRYGQLGCYTVTVVNYVAMLLLW